MPGQGQAQHPLADHRQLQPGLRVLRQAGGSHAPPRPTCRRGRPLQPGFLDRSGLRPEPLGFHDGHVSDFRQPAPFPRPSGRRASARWAPSPRASSRRTSGSAASSTTPTPRAATSTSTPSRRASGSRAPRSAGHRRSSATRPTASSSPTGTRTRCRPAGRPRGRGGSSAPASSGATS